MITEEKKFTAEISSSLDVIKMGIDQDSVEDMSSILEILGDSMYSNKPLTLIREYCTNAYDAHVEAGIEDIPIEVFLPSAFKPEFKVRDYGFGLSREDMQVFASYGKSTKRNSNSVIGHLGVGCKSAFSYTDNFTIVSIHEGIKSLYSATKDATGYKIYCLNSEPTDERSGLEISVVVKSKDVSSFISNAKSFFRFFNPRPVFVNNSDIIPSIENFHHTKLIDANNWIVYNWYQENHLLYVVMGNITYPVNLENLNLDTSLNTFLHYWNSKVIVLFANIGDVSHASTRENLKYDDKTKSWLIDKISKMPDETAFFAQKFIDECKSYWDAKVLASTLQSSKIGNAINKVEYNGIKVNTNAVSTTNYLPSHSVYFNKFSSKWEKVSFIKPRENTIVFYSKGDTTASSRYERYHNYRLQNQSVVNNSHCYLVYFKNAENAEKFISQPDLEGCTMIDLASCHFVKPNRKKNVFVVPVGSILLYKEDGHRCNNADYWESPNYISDIDTKYFVEICHYKPKNSLYNDVSSLATILRDLRYIKTIDVKLYGVKSTEVSKLDDTWVNIADLFKEEAIRIAESESFKSYFTHSKLYNNSENYRILRAFKDYKRLISEEHPIYDFLNSLPYNNHDVFIYDRYNSYSYMNGEKYVDNEKYDEILEFVNEFMKKYYLLNHIVIDYKNITDVLRYTNSG